MRPNYIRRSNDKYPRNYKSFGFEAKLRSFDVDVKLQFIWFLGQTTFVKAINGPYSELGFWRAYLVRGTAFYGLFFVPVAFEFSLVGHQ